MVSGTSALETLAAVETVRVDPEGPTTRATEMELAAATSPTSAVIVEAPVVIAEALAASTLVEVSPQLAAPTVEMALTTSSPCPGLQEHAAPADEGGSAPSEIQEVGEGSGGRPTSSAGLQTEPTEGGVRILDLTHSSLTGPRQVEPHDDEDEEAATHHHLERGLGWA